MLGTLIKITRPFRSAIEGLLFNMSGERRNLQKLKGKYADKPLLIVGNGPSLNKTPLEQFSHIDSIGMNKIDMLFPRTEWRPSMIFCTNTMVVKQHRSVFESLDLPVYLSWKSRWFVKKRSAKIQYFNSFFSHRFQEDPTKGIGPGATVTYAALQFAYYMEANPVIIVGVDHNFDRSEDKVVYEKREGADNNHFDPNYFAPGSMWGVPLLNMSEENYEEARIAFEKKGWKIYDATIDGKLTIFEKISIEEALALSGSPANSEA